MGDGRWEAGDGRREGRLSLEKGGLQAFSLAVSWLSRWDPQAAWPQGEKTVGVSWMLLCVAFAGLNETLASL